MRSCFFFFLLLSSSQSYYLSLFPFRFSLSYLHDSLSLSISSVLGVVFVAPLCISLQLFMMYGFAHRPVQSFLSIYSHTASWFVSPIISSTSPCLHLSQNHPSTHLSLSWFPFPVILCSERNLHCTCQHSGSPERKQRLSFLLQCDVLSNTTIFQNSSPIHSFFFIF